MNTEERILALKAVGFLSSLDEAALRELAACSVERTFAAGRTIVNELEYGSDVYVLSSGKAEVSIGSQTGKRQVLGELVPGDSFGEMASITGQLRSASVRSLSSVVVLILPDPVFDRLRIYRPEVASALLQIMAGRLAETERTLTALLSSESAAESEGVRLPRSNAQLLWRELVVNHRKELSFLTLIAFAAALLVVRGVAHACFRYDLAPREVLRAIYVTGFGLLIASACAALLTYRPNARRAIAIAYGIGAAFIVNELGVTLAFDIYYKDIFTPDPRLAFDVERLYRRTEPVVATIVGFVLLFQAVYLKEFYSRLWHLVRMRLRLLLRGRALD